METYIDLYVNPDGEKVTTVYKKIVEMGFKPTIGEHDFVYSWTGIVSIEEELAFVEKIQSKLKGTGAILRFTSVR